LEQRLLKRGKEVKKLFGFLRLHRHEIFDPPFQDVLATMYRDTGAGESPVSPAQMAMAMLLQGYAQSSDAETVELTVVDLRWQMVLGCLGAEDPAFGQGTFQEFRERMIRHDMDRRLLERTVEVAKQSQGFDWKKLPKSLRVAMDSRPLEGAGKVEDTINLLGHAARKIVETAARILDVSVAEICRVSRCPVLLAPSIKAGLDANWNNPIEKDDALGELVTQLASLTAWVERALASEALNRPLDKYIRALEQVEAQDLVWTKKGEVAIRDGVAPDRRISIDDEEMRHGRKSRSKKYNGYKELMTIDLDYKLILACAVTAANVPDEVGGDAMRTDVQRQGEIRELHIDRAFMNGDLVQGVAKDGGTILCKPWLIRNRHEGLFSKSDFEIDVRAKTITCPSGQTEAFEFGETVHFDPEACGACTLRGSCTHSANGRGRSVNIAEDERLQKKLRKLQQTKPGRARLRERVAVEHAQAHTAQRKGRRARYRTSRKNLLDLRRIASIQNLETIQRNGTLDAHSTRSAL
jgi:hypothetical protein